MYLRDQPPEDEIFDEMVEKSKSVRDWYDDQYWYSTDKKQRIDDMWWNRWSNFMTIFQMFDYWNQQLLLAKASKKLKDAIKERLDQF